MANRNLEIMRRTLAPFSAGDMASLAQLLAPDVVRREPGASALAKDYRGRDEVSGFFGRLIELTGGTFRAQSLDILANDAGGIFVDRVTAERNGRVLDVRLLLHVRIVDDRIVEAVDYFHQEQLWDAFWA